MIILSWRLKTLSCCTGLWGRDITSRVGDCEGALHQGRHSRALGGESGYRRRWARVHLCQRVPGHLPDLRDTQASAESPARQVILNNTAYCSFLWLTLVYKWQQVWTTSKGVKQAILCLFYKTIIIVKPITILFSSNKILFPIFVKK